MAENTTKPDNNNLLADDGLILKGLVVAVKVEDKSWEGKNYKRLEATITNGKSTWFYRFSDTAGPIPEIHPFRRILIIVQSANSEKGNTVVKGEVLSHG
ncbi:hypothetical protein [Cerasicoccus arenae]|uniref:Uncharacterized protein n=1 Tax=Cerasicoccus arenae TaxID=424488 RepID=A0A8J3DL02_9BACT|nr:hypothetical protein [Cerasicoccus arenae]MBK1860023.1 hypothetical protein [Cerasicoccus arenae]GHC12580.1 hypothetical protein GCM10007047_32430 [Cerasicoccus arenae]